MSPESQPVLYLIDGYALIYRAFFAMIARPLRTSRGENTSSVWGVANFLHRLFRDRAPTYVAWVHDAGTSFRDEIFPEYKATRQKLNVELQEDFDRSVERIESLLHAFRVPLIEVDGYEADDVIGTLATQAEAQDVPVIIVSGDKDFYQLISPAVSLLNPGRGGPAAVEEKFVGMDDAAERFGVPPERVVDYLALVGDASDNVPGVKGIGDKTARRLIQTYGDLDAILAHAAEVSAKRAREALLAEGDNARLSRQLTTILRDVPVTLDLEEFRTAPPDGANLRRLYTELEFHSLLAKVSSEAAAAPAKPKYCILHDIGEIGPMVKRVRGAGIIGVQVVGTSSDSLDGDLVGLALSVGGDGGWYLPLGHRTAQGELIEQPRTGNLPGVGELEMQTVLDVLTDPGIRKAVHDAKSVRLWLRPVGADLAGVVFDSMLASFLLDPGRRSHTLETLAADHLGLGLKSYADVVGKGKTKQSFAEVGLDEAAEYCCGQSDAVLRWHDHVDAQMGKLGARRLLEEVELPLVDVLVAMEGRGITVDCDRLVELGAQFGNELAEFEQAIFREAGTEFNINSTQQLRHILFEKLNLPVIKKTKTGASTSAEVLAELAGMDFALPKLLLEYRELTKLKSTYVDVLPARVDSRTGRIHTRFNQVGAATGRLSSSDPNLQNIPVRTRRGELIRQCFVPAQDHLFVVADYSQVELRLLAHLSEDAAFVAAFQRGGDIHQETAAIIFDVPPDGVTPEMRARAKTINFATIYGQGPFALSRQLGMSQEEAREFIRVYFERFAGVRRYLDATITHARKRGYVETIFGRRRYIPELQDKNHNMRSFGERVAMNSPLQGAAADLIKIAMINLYRALHQAGLASAILLQVHDELVLEAPEPEVEQTCSIVRQAMEGVKQLRVPLLVEVGVGPNWLDAKP